MRVGGPALQDPPLDRRVVGAAGDLRVRGLAVVAHGASSLPTAPSALAEAGVGDVDAAGREDGAMRHVRFDVATLAIEGVPVALQGGVPAGGGVRGRRPPPVGVPGLRARHRAARPGPLPDRHHHPRWADLSGDGRPRAVGRGRPRRCGATGRSRASTDDLTVRERRDQRRDQTGWSASDRKATEDQDAPDATSHAPQPDLMASQSIRSRTGREGHSRGWRCGSGPASPMTALMAWPIARPAGPAPTRGSRPSTLRWRDPTGELVRVRGCPWPGSPDPGPGSKRLGRAAHGPCQRPARTMT